MDYFYYTSMMLLHLFLKFESLRAHSLYCTENSNHSSEFLFFHFMEKKERNVGLERHEG